MNPVPWSLRAQEWLLNSVPTFASIHMSRAMPMLQDASFVCSLGWILYRIWQIYQKPNEELVDLLGLDIPPVPEVSLAGIAAESVLLYWKPPENQSTTLRYVIQVNGIRVGDFGHGDTSIHVIGLKSSHFYSIRVIATNATNFSTVGPLIRLRTRSSQSASPSSIIAPRDSALECNTYNGEPASVRTTPSHFDVSSSLGITHMTRYYSANNVRRTALCRHSSSLTQNNDNMAVRILGSGSDDGNEAKETIGRLTQELDVVRREQQEIDKQFHEDEQESKQIMTELTKDRDQLKHTLKDKEDTSSDLRKHGNYLDKLNRNAQSRKAAKEKILFQKRAERQKMEDEIIRWDEQRLDMNRKIDEMLAEKASIMTIKDEELGAVRRQITHDQALIKSLEEDMRVKGIQIKEMEREKEKPNNVAGLEQEYNLNVKESEHAWEVKVQTTQAQLAALWQALQQAQAENQKAQENLAWWISKRSRDPTQFVPAPAFDFISSIKSNRSRRIRQGKSRTSTNSIPSGGYPVSHLAFNSVSAISPKFAVASPFFNMSNGMTVPSLEQAGSPQKDMDSSTDGGAMSPAANDLLPSNLFRDEDIMARRVSDNTTGHDSLDSMSSELLDGLGASNVEAIAYGPHTPISVSSHAGSLFSSPHDSLHNLHNYQSRAESFAESDHQSITSTGGSYHPVMAAESNPLAASRIASLFTTTFNRQRGKSSTHEPPSLGTLKQGQSQSFPRNLEAGILDPMGSRRRRGSYGNWAKPVAGLLNRSTTGSSIPPEDSGLITARTGSGRRSRLNMFGSKFDEMESTPFTDKFPSSRPSSTYSFDTGLGRPSNENQNIGRPVLEGVLNRSSPLGIGWSATGGPWCRGPSRRPSVQHGSSTSNLSLGSTPLESECYQGTLTKQVSEQLPIGTRPPSSHRPMTPKLNPAAPSFKTLFSRGDAKRTAKSEKTIDKTIDKIPERWKDKEHERAEGEETDSTYEESSPPDPRLSRDAQSVNTTASLAESHDSLDRSTSGTPSEVVAPAGPKETLMQRITRKSSSSKFNVPWGKERSGIFSKRGGEPSTPDEINEDVPNESQLGRSVESMGSIPQQEKGSRNTLSWPNIRRKSKKNGQTTFETVERISDDDDP